MERGRAIGPHDTHPSIHFNVFHLAASGWEAGMGPARCPRGAEAGMGFLGAGAGAGVSTRGILSYQEVQGQEKDHQGSQMQSLRAHIPDVEASRLERVGAAR